MLAVLKANCLITKRSILTLMSHFYSPIYTIIGIILVLNIYGDEYK